MGKQTEWGRMPQRDRHHRVVRNALIADGWSITHDPYPIKLEARQGFIDLGAEMPLAAERGGIKIAVEIKTFIGPSPVTDLASALGQYLLYRSWIGRSAFHPAWKRQYTDFAVA